MLAKLLFPTDGAPHLGEKPNTVGIPFMCYYVIFVKYLIHRNIHRVGPFLFSLE